MSRKSCGGRVYFPDQRDILFLFLEKIFPNQELWVLARDITLPISKQKKLSVGRKPKREIFIFYNEVNFAVDYISLNSIWSCTSVFDGKYLSKLCFFFQLKMNVNVLFSHSQTARRFLSGLFLSGLIAAKFYDGVLRQIAFLRIENNSQILQN